VVKDVCGEKSKVSDGNCLIKVENGITTMAGNAKDILEALEEQLAQRHTGVNAAKQEQMR